MIFTSYFSNNKFEIPTNKIIAVTPSGNHSMVTVRWAKDTQIEIFEVVGKARDINTRIEENY